jgi:hypothetical protein
LLIYILEELRERGKHVNNESHHDDSELHSLALPSEGLHDELEGDLLKCVVHNAILNDSTKELGNLFQIWVRVLMEESVLVEE